MPHFRRTHLVYQFDEYLTVVQCLQPQYSHRLQRATPYAVHIMQGIYDRGYYDLDGEAITPAPAYTPVCFVDLPLDVIDSVIDTWETVNCVVEATPHA
jgi:hypothetical protein